MSNFKKLVEERIEKTGESWATAARHVRAKKVGPCEPRLAVTAAPPPPTLLEVLFAACTLTRIAVPEQPFGSLDDFKRLVRKKCVSRASQAQHQQKRWIDEAIKMAEAGKAPEAADCIKSAIMVSGPSFLDQFQQLGEGLRLKPSPWDQLGKGLAGSFKRPSSMFGALKMENPLGKLAQMYAGAQIVSQRDQLIKAMAPMQITQLKIQPLKIQELKLGSDLRDMGSSMKAIGDQQRQLRELVLGPMERIRAAVKASRPKRMRKPRPKKPPTETPAG